MQELLKKKTNLIKKNYNERWTSSNPWISWLLISLKNRLANDDAAVTFDGLTTVSAAVVVVDDDVSSESILDSINRTNKQSKTWWPRQVICLSHQHLSRILTNYESSISLV